MNHRAINILFSCALLSGPVISQSQNPIFGTDYDQREIRYEKFPDVAKRICANVGFVVKYFWVYAHYKSQDSDYYIVMDSRPDPEHYDLADAIWIQGLNCIEEDDAGWTLSGVPPKNGYASVQSEEILPGMNAPKLYHGAGSDAAYYVLRSPHEEETLRGLVRDGIRRAISARGSDTSFRKQACSPRILSLNAQSSPVVEQELKAFCTRSPAEAAPRN